MKLKEWTSIYLKQRDIIKRSIQEIKGTEEGIEVHYKDGTNIKVIVKEELLGEEQADIICTLNTKKNVTRLLEKWEYYASQEHLQIIFANPKTNEQWIIKPHLHNKIADPQSLKTGIKSMHESVARV